MLLIDQVLSELLDFCDSPHLKVAGLGSPYASFTTMSLSDGSIGSALNFPAQNNPDGKIPANFPTIELLKKEPVGPVFSSILDGYDLSLKVALATALSQSLYRKGGIPGFTIRAASNWLETLTATLVQHESLLQIGFGGAIDMANQISGCQICVTDLSFDCPEEIRRAESHLNDHGLDAVKLLSTESAGKLLPEFSALCVSGSSLCNDTLGDILQQSNASVLFLQGPSAPLLSPCLFRQGVTHIASPLKRPEELTLAREISDELLDYVDGNYMITTVSSGSQS